MEEHYHKYTTKSKGKKHLLRELVSHQQVKALCVLDCFSTRAAELSWFMADCYFKDRQINYK